MAASSCPHCLFVVSVDCRTKVRDADASAALLFTNENYQKMVKFTCNELYINSLEYNIGVVASFRRIQLPMTLHLKLFFWYGVLIGHFRSGPQ